MTGISASAEQVTAVIAACAAIGAAYKWAWYGKRDRHGRRQPGVLKRAIQTMGNVNDAILGREAITDPETGRELAPAKPGIGTRMANTEANLEVLTKAVAKIADTHERLTDIEKRLTTVETVVGVERALKQVESIELLRTMDTAIRADPDPGDKP